MKQYRIADWDRKFEVNDKSGQWEPGQTFRQGPLKYLRMPAGARWDHRMVWLQQLAGNNRLLCQGAYQSLCQIVADQNRDLREGGVIRKEDGRPATDEQIARMLVLEPKVWLWIAKILSDPRVGLIEVVQSPDPTGSDDQQSPPQQRIESRGQRTELGVQHCPHPFLNEAPELPEAVPETPGTPAPPLYQESRVKESRSSHKNQQEKIQVKVETVPQSVAQTEDQPEADPEDCPQAADDPVETSYDSTCRSLLKTYDSTRLPDMRVRLAVLHYFHKTLKITGLNVHAIRNFERWLYRQVEVGRAKPEVYRQAMDIAADCVNGRCPVAVFMSRVEASLGYTPPSRRYKAVGQAARAG